MRAGKVLELHGKVTIHSSAEHGHTTDTPQGGERVNLPNRKQTPELQKLFLRDYNVSWAGLSSPLRTLPYTTALTYRHTPLQEVWREDE